MLKHAEVVHFDQRQSADFQSFFVQCFRPLRDKMTDYMDKLFDQFTEYRSLPESLSVEHDHIDHMWHCLGNLRGCDSFCFNLLFEVVKYILLLPHSNADEERIFSMASKNRTKFSVK